MPDYSSNTNGHRFVLSDRDQSLNGDTAADEVGDNSDQVLTVYIARNNVGASGRAHAEDIHTLDDGVRNIIKVIEIGGVRVGYLAERFVQPGKTFAFVATSAVTSTNLPPDSTLVDNYYTQTRGASVGGHLAVNLLLVDGADTVDVDAGNDTVDGRAG